MSEHLAIEAAPVVPQEVTFSDPSTIEAANASGNIIDAVEVTEVPTAESNSVPYGEQPRANTGEQPASGNGNIVWSDSGQDFNGYVSSDHTVPKAKTPLKMRMGGNWRDIPADPNSITSRASRLLIREMLRPRVQR